MRLLRLQAHWQEVLEVSKMNPIINKQTMNLTKIKRLKNLPESWRPSRNGPADTLVLEDNEEEGSSSLTSRRIGSISWGSSLKASRIQSKTLATRALSGLRVLLTLLRAVEATPPLQTPMTRTCEAHLLNSTLRPNSKRREVVSPTLRPSRSKSKPRTTLNLKLARTQRMPTQPPTLPPHQKGVPVYKWTSMV